jgi:hypothetical protein
MATKEAESRLVGEAGSVELLKADAAGALRSFRMLAYTGAEIMRWYGRVVVDMDGLTVPKKLPILLNHDANLVAGYATSSEVTGKGLVLTGALLSGEAGPRVAQMSDDGFPLTASIGVNIAATEELEAGQSAKCNGKTVEGPLTIWRKASLFETSFVTANPADKSTSAAALTQEKPMKPEEFLKAFPDAVKAWKDEAAKAEREALMARLGELLKAIPGRAEFVLAQFSQGADVLTAKAALCDVLQAEKAEAAKAHAAPSAPAPNPVLEALKQKAGNPGVGFDGVAREKAGAEQLGALPPLERAKAEFAKDPQLAKFTTVEALAACYRAEARGLVRPDTITRAASVMAGAQE